MLKSALIVVCVFFMGFLINALQAQDVFVPEKLSEILKLRKPNGTMIFKKDVIHDLKNFDGDKVFLNYGHLFSLEEGVEFRFSNRTERKRKAAGDYTFYSYDMWYKGFLVKKKAAHFKERDDIIYEGFVADLEFNKNVDINFSINEIEVLAQKYFSKGKLNRLEKTKLEFISPVFINQVFDEKEVGAFQLVYKIRMSILDPDPSIVKDERIIAISPFDGSMVANYSIVNK